MLISGLSAAPFVNTLTTLRWNGDIEIDELGRRAIKEFLRKMITIQTISLQGCIHSKQERDTLKARARQDRQAELILSPEEDTSESEDEKAQESEEDNSSDLGEELY